MFICACVLEALAQMFLSKASLGNYSWVSSLIMADSAKASKARFGNIVNAYILAGSNTRESERGKYFETFILTDEQPSVISSLNGPMTKFGMIKEGFYMLTSVQVGMDTFWLRDSSRVIPCREFDVNRSIVDSFKNPAIMTVSQAKVSPKKMRLTLEGEVTEVKDRIASKKYQRRVIKMSDGKETIQVKLWGEQSKVNIKRSTYIKVTGLNIGEYLDETDANSSSNTEIQNIDVPLCSVDGIVDGASFEPGDALIIIGGEPYGIDFEVLRGIFPALTYDADSNIRVSGNRRLSQIVQLMQVADPEEETDEEDAVQDGIPVEGAQGGLQVAEESD